MKVNLVLEPLPAWDGFVPEWAAADGGYWLSRGPSLYQAESLGAAPRLVIRFPLGGWKRVVSGVSLARRLLRLSFYAVVPRPDGSVFVSFDRSFGILRDGRVQPVQGLAKAFRNLRGGVALAPSGAIYFGEYVINRGRTDSVNIYRLPPGSSQAEIVHTFAPAEVRHVHSVRWDDVSTRLWICCGDLPAECRILTTTEDFKNIETVGAGDESWRAIQPIFQKHEVYYATDAEFDPNAIYRIHRDTGVRDRVTAIDGPSYYGGSAGAFAIYATTAELCPSQSKRAAELWAVDRDGAQCLGVYKKDLLGIRKLVAFFQPGLVLFPAGPGAGPLALTGMGLKGLSGRVFVLKASHQT